MAYLERIFEHAAEEVTIPNPLTFSGLVVLGKVNRLDFSSAVIVAANKEGAIIKAGASGAPVVSNFADTKFISLRFDCGATSGDNRGIYNRLYLTGAGGGGESLRSYTEITGVAASTAHGAHISLGMGESTVKGSVTGLGVAVRATLGLPNVALASGGKYAALQAEIYSFGNDSDPAAVAELSFMRCINGGTTNGKADVDDKAFLFVLDGFASGAAKTWYDHQGSAPANIEEWVKVKTPGGTRWLALYNAIA